MEMEKKTVPKCERQTHWEPIGAPPSAYSNCPDPVDFRFQRAIVETPAEQRVFMVLDRNWAETEIKRLS